MSPSDPSESTHPLRTLRRRMTIALWLLLVFGGLTLGCLTLLKANLRRAQIQSDPKVATVWILGVTHGPKHTITQGTPLQRWFNANNIHAFGDYHALKSRYNGEAGVEVWFDYESHLPLSPQLECHRVGETAFSDDLGQSYHGFLDMQGHYVGVYLPNYDHAAHRLFCVVRWMPRQPAVPHPASAPMAFTISLPPAPRLLPPADTLPRDPLSQTSQEITVTVSEARLSAPKLTPGSDSQRDLLFRMKIRGGRLANANVAESSMAWWQSDLFSQDRTKTSLSKTERAASLFWREVIPNVRLVSPPGAGAGTASRFTITDPYGVSLLVSNANLSPMMSMEETRRLPDSNGRVWIAPVNGVGRGTDAVRLHFDIRPTPSPEALPTGNAKPASPEALPVGNAKPAAPLPTVPFDLVVPVQTGDEV